MNTFHGLSKVVAAKTDRLLKAVEQEVAATGNHRAVTSLNLIIMRTPTIDPHLLPPQKRPLGTIHYYLPAINTNTTPTAASSARTLEEESRLIRLKQVHRSSLVTAQTACISVNISNITMPSWS